MPLLVGALVEVARGGGETCFAFSCAVDEDLNRPIVDVLEIDVE